MDTVRRLIPGERWWPVAALVGPFALAGAFVALRSRVDNTNLALGLVIAVVLGASTGRRLNGVIAAVSASLGFDLFLTRPYYSFDISRRSDVETFVALLVVGLLVSEISLRGRRAAATASRRADYLNRVQAIGEMTHHNTTAATGDAVAQEILSLLPLASCRYEDHLEGRRRLPILEADGTVLRPYGTWSVLERGFPDDMLEIPTRGSSGRFLLVPIVGVPVDEERLRLAAMLVDRFRAAEPAAG